MSIKTDFIMKVQNKAKTKKDGIYSYMGDKYIVRNNQVMFVTDFNSVYQLCGIFVSKVWSGESHQMKEVLKQIAKSGGEGDFG